MEHIDFRKYIQKQTTVPRRSMGYALDRPFLGLNYGYLNTDERDRTLHGIEKYRTYSNLAINCYPAAASTQIFLGLVGNGEWSVIPTDEDDEESKRLADLAWEMLTEDPESDWIQTVKYLSTYALMGYTVMNWSARRRDDGIVTLDKISPRPQYTLERFATDNEGNVTGFWQRQRDRREILIPRENCVYLRDDLVKMEGTGIYRKCVPIWYTIRRYQQLLGTGYETDLRGIVKAFAPLAELNEAVDDEDEELTREQADEMAASIYDFAQNHVRNAKSGIVLDSSVEQGENLDGSSKPIPIRKWDIDLLRGSSNSFREMETSLARLDRAIARIFGTESSYLGDASSGSYALSADKNDQLSLLIDSVLLNVSKGIQKDILKPLWRVNNFDPKKMPKLSVELTRYTPTLDKASTLQMLSLLNGTDPAINILRNELNLPAVDLIDDDPIEDDDPLENENQNEGNG